MRRSQLFPSLLLAACGTDVPVVRVCAGGGAEHATIGSALATAPVGARIELCAGIYAEPLDLVGVTVHLRGASADTSILDAGGVRTAIAISASDVTIEDLTIRGGVALGRGGGVSAVDSRVEIVDSRLTGNSAEEGGAIAALGGVLTVRGTELRGNVAALRGGAIFLSGDGTIEDSLLADNRSGWTGGAIYVDAHAPTIRGNTVDGNAAVEEGGGIYLHQSRALIADNQITSNRAEDDGGGLRLFESEAVLERNRIARNVAGGDGGGLKSSHRPSRLIDNQVVDNECEGAGGGLELDNDASQVTGGAVTGNRAGRGGGIHVMLAPWDGGFIEDVRIADNHGWLGGGLHLENNFVSFALRRLTIEGNLADEGGGLYARGGHFALTNAVLAGNQAYQAGGGIFLGTSDPWDEECPCPPADPPVSIGFVVLHANTAEQGAALWTDAPGVTIESSIMVAHEGAAVVAEPGRRPAWRYNDVHPASFGGMTDPTGGDGNLSLDPQLVAPGTGDFRLAAASPCIDAGNPTFSDPDGSRADMGLHAGPGAP